MSTIPAGYPITGALGPKSLAVVQHVGPASYVQIATTGDPLDDAARMIRRLHA